jgi:hypothetical protein
MEKRWTRWALMLTVIVGAISAVLGTSNPDLQDYQQEVLSPLAQERHSTADAMLTSILQSIAIPRSDDARQPPAPTVLTILTDRTKRSNYGMFSVYTTEFDYCEENHAVRTIGRSLAIAGKFYMIEKGECPGERNS